MRNLGFFTKLLNLIISVHLTCSPFCFEDCLRNVPPLQSFVDRGLTYLDMYIVPALMVYKAANYNQVQARMECQLMLA